MTEQMDNVSFDISVQVSIRQLRKDDLRKLEWHGQFTHYRRLFMRSYQGQRKGNRHLLVATVNDFPIGRLFIQFSSPRRDNIDEYLRGYLYSFHLMEMFRGQGIGTHLIQRAENILHQHHFDYATIAVAQTNDGARRLYQRHGYDIVEEDEGKWSYYDHLGRLQTVNEPCWLLEKRL
ncbi:MAG: GNAT family N-acetyltransferase [Chloroflexota bacterium]